MKTFIEYLNEEPETHKDVALKHGFVEKEPGRFHHPDGHELREYQGNWTLKHNDHFSTWPGHKIPKYFNQQVAKLVKPAKHVAPKWKQSAMPDSKGKHKKV